MKKSIDRNSPKAIELRKLKSKIFRQMDEGIQPTREDINLIEQLTEETGLAEEIDLPN